MMYASESGPAAPAFPSYSVSGKAGASFKPQHLGAILEETSSIGFLEIHAENYMGAGGPPHAALARARRDLPITLHGVCMSIGGPQPIDRHHLERFARLVERYRPEIVSEHLAWSTHDDIFYNDLLPLPYTRETLRQVCAHIAEVQDRIGRPILLENPSTYVAFQVSDFSETDFLRAIVADTGCGLLLDINNVIVSATNHGYSAETYLGDFPLEHVGEIHLAGHAEEKDDQGRPLLIDSHDRAVSDPVWGLYQKVIERRGPIPTLVEWDNDVPEWPVLRNEARCAQAILDAHHLQASLRYASRT